MSEFELPDEWVLTELGTVIDLNPKEKLNDDLIVGFMPMSGMPIDYLGKLFYEEKNWKEVKQGYTQFKNGDVLFAKITPCFENGKAAIVEKFPNGIGAGSTEYFVLRPKVEIHPKLLLALVKSKSFLTQGALNMSGSVGHKRVPKTFVESYPFPLPSWAEQQEIASRLDTLLAQVDVTKARLDGIPALLKRFRQSVLAAAVSGNLKSHQDVDSSIVGPLSDFVSIDVGFAFKSAEFTDNGIKLLRGQNIEPGSLRQYFGQFS